MKTEGGTVKGKIRFYCEALEVTRYGFYLYLENLNKPPKYADLIAKIYEIIDEDECNDTYGRERIFVALKLKREIAEAAGEDFPKIPSEGTVRKIMISEGLIHEPKRKPGGLTKADKEAQKSDNLIKSAEKEKSDFAAEKPCEKIVGDITETPCLDGKLYISIFADCFNNEILGLSMADNMRAELVRDTLKMAVSLHPELRMNSAIAHTDRGSQYTSDLYRKYIEKQGLQQSMNSAAGRCHDNAKAESIFARFKEELLYGRYDTTKMTMEEVKTLVWRYFMSYWNNRRICMANGGVPPTVKRQRFYDTQKMPLSLAA